jgi:hypothetical protein
MTHTLTLDDILSRIRSRDYFKFVKLNHGFWQRICFFGAEELSLEEVNSNICKYVIENADEDYRGRIGLGGDIQRPPAILAQSYPEILRLMQIEDERILWGVSPSGHRFGPVYPEAVKTISKFAPTRRYCGQLWKDLVFDGTILKFFRRLQGHKVVVIGLRHLKNSRMPVKHDFYEIRNPVSSYADELVLDLERYHRRFRPTVYLSEMSDVGIPILCKAELENAFVFDMGQAIDIFTDKLHDPNHPPWMKYIPANLRTIYARQRCDLIGYS